MAFEESKQRQQRNLVLTFEDCADHQLQLLTLCPPKLSFILLQYFHIFFLLLDLSCSNYFLTCVSSGRSSLRHHALPERDPSYQFSQRHRVTTTTAALNCYKITNATHAMHTTHQLSNNRGYPTTHPHDFFTILLVSYSDPTMCLCLCPDYYSHPTMCLVFTTSYCHVLTPPMLCAIVLTPPCAAQRGV